MSRRVQWTRETGKSYKTVPADKRRKIADAMELLAEHGIGKVKALQGEHRGKYRLRVGDYRVTFGWTRMATSGF